MSNLPLERRMFASKPGPGFFLRRYDGAISVDIEYFG
jgi:hypothetical protein